MSDLNVWLILTAPLFGYGLGLIHGVFLGRVWRRRHVPKAGQYTTTLTVAPNRAIREGDEVIISGSGRCRVVAVDRCRVLRVD